MCMVHSLCMPRRPSPGCLEGLLCTQPAASLGNKLSWGPYPRGRSQDAPAQHQEVILDPGQWKGRQRERHSEVRQGKPVGSQVRSMRRTSS
uniref:Alternative protein SRL n=1 Tax=Homo sapiens TaxID=9606 RepID=L8E8M1_HUMAN|nr:alternative protein SRL [Homo sapiens]